ncbi:hypothetical protein B6U99_07800, partial [Candidatus Geothermarchaeota archaeon ex4572_27]
GMMDRVMGRVKKLSGDAGGNPFSSLDFFARHEPLRKFLKKKAGSAIMVVFGASQGGTSLGLAAAVTSADGGTKTPVLNLVLTNRAGMLANKDIGLIQDFVTRNKGAIFANRVNIIFVNRHHENGDQDIDMIFEKVLKVLTLSYARRAAKCHGDEPHKLLTYHGTLTLGVLDVPVEVRGADVIHVDVRWRGCRDSVGDFVGGPVAWTYAMVAAPSAHVANEVVKAVGERLRVIGVLTQSFRTIVHHGLDGVDLLVLYPISRHWLESHPVLAPVAELVSTIKPREMVKATTTMIREFTSEAARLLESSPMDKGWVSRLEGVLNSIASYMVLNDEAFEPMSRVLEAYARFYGEIKKLHNELRAAQEERLRVRRELYEDMPKLVEAIVRGDDTEKKRIEERIAQLRTRHGELVRRCEEAQGRIKELLEELPKLISLDMLGGVHGGGGAGQASLEGS